MQSKDNTPKLPIEVGRLTIRLNKGSYLETRFQFNGVPYTLSGGKYTPERLEVAIAIAQEIDSSITFRTFNGIEKYKKQTIEKPTPINNIVISQPKEMTIKDVWEFYAAINEDKAAKSSKEDTWRRIDKMFVHSKQYLDLQQTFEFIISAKEVYADIAILNHFLKNILAV